MARDKALNETVNPAKRETGEGRWVDVTPELIASRMGWVKDEELSPTEIEAVLDDIVPGLLARKVPPGFHILWLHGLEHPLAGPLIPPLPEAKAAALVKLAEDDPYAFDAACYLVAKHFGISHPPGNPDCPPSLRRFGVRILVDGLKRPRKRGRPLDRDQLLRIIQYSLCLLVAENSKFKLSRNRSPYKDATSDDSRCRSACDAVAEAFTRAGRHTTHDQMASLCYDWPHREVRASALLCLMTGPTSGCP